MTVNAARSFPFSCKVCVHCVGDTEKFFHEPCRLSENFIRHLPGSDFVCTSEIVQKRTVPKDNATVMSDVPYPEPSTKPGQNLSVLFGGERFTVQSITAHTSVSAVVRGRNAADMSANHRGRYRQRLRQQRVFPRFIGCRCLYVRTLAPSAEGGRLTGLLAGRCGPRGRTHHPERRGYVQTSSVCFKAPRTGFSCQRCGGGQIRYGTLWFAVCQERFVFSPTTLSMWCPASHTLYFRCGLSGSNTISMFPICSVGLRVSLRVDFFHPPDPVCPTSARQSRVRLCRLNSPICHKIFPVLVRAVIPVYHCLPLPADVRRTTILSATNSFENIFGG